MGLSSADFTSPDLRIPSLGVLAALIIIFYFLSRAGTWRNEFGMFDAAILITGIAVGTAAAIPFFEASSRQASEAVLLQNLNTLRTQIEFYKAQHGGAPPLVYRGGFPQLVAATDHLGVPGAPSPKRPYGPYFPAGLPRNPVTGSATVTEVAAFPPAAPTGNGGWTYHQASGRIGVDLAGYLDR